MAALILADTQPRQGRGTNRPTCRIQWIDAQGKPTPDSNPAVARARCKAGVEQHDGRAIQFDQSQLFHGQAWARRSRANSCGPPLVQHACACSRPIGIPNTRDRIPSAAIARARG
jgi:hypothetical protein